MREILKRRVILPILLTVGVSATTTGHTSEPIQPLNKDEFRAVLVPKSGENVPIIADNLQKYDKSGTNRPISAIKDQNKANKAKIEPKTVPEPKMGNKPPSRAKVKAWTRAKLNNDTQFACLDKLWWKESAWRWNGGHPSRAYGIPQAYPGSKMASEGADWLTNPITQVKWGLKYIKARYGTACKAWEHSKRYNWY